MNLRWLNTGRPLAGQSVDRVSGNALSSRDFRLCEACGKLDTDTRASSAREHRPWCRYRSDSAEHVIAVDLMRELSTEALAFVLPLGFATDRVGVDSLGLPRSSWDWRSPPVAPPITVPKSAPRCPPSRLPMAEPNMAPR